MPRPIAHTYTDPLDLVWTAAAARLGMRIERSAEVYASWDGRGTLTLSSQAHFDPDDSLAQLVLHEICHALVEGPALWEVPDWGLDNFADADWLREHACQRLQAALAQEWGLRGFFATTTDYRTYYDALPAEPLAQGDDPAIALALPGWARAREAPVAEVLRDAFAATAAIVAAARRFAPPGSVYGADGRAVEAGPR